MGEDDTEYVEGVNFGELNEVLEDISYPITSDKLVERYGDHEIERTNAETITIRELFEPVGNDTLESMKGVQQRILSLMPKDSVGRQRYSDRGVTIDDPGEFSQREDSDVNPEEEQTDTS